MTKRTTTNPATPGAACAGREDLFTSDDARHHYEAASICAGCPAVRACRRAREALEADGYTAHGTWHGEAFGYTKRSILDAIEDRYTDAQAAAAMRAYANGLRTPWAVDGRRVYDRRKYRAAQAAERLVS